jgi:hypothetical protein
MKTDTFTAISSAELDTVSGGAFKPLTDFHKNAVLGKTGLSEVELNEYARTYNQSHSDMFIRGAIKGNSYFPSTFPSL